MKKMFLIILLSLLFSSTAYGDWVFDKACSALEKGATDLQLRKIEDECKDKFISGRGYVTRVAKNVWGDTVVHLSTAKDPYSSSSVDVTVFLKKGFDERALRLDKGDSVNFSGTFKDILMNSIIVHDGEI